MVLITSTGPFIQKVGVLRARTQAFKMQRSCFQIRLMVQRLINSRNITVQETKVGNADESNDTSGVSLDGWKPDMSDARLSIAPNKQDISSASGTAQPTSSEKPFHSSDPDLTQTDIVRSLDSFPESQKCKAQSGTKFGCIPLTPIYVYKGKPRIWDPVPDVHIAPRFIRDTEILNFFGLCIPVKLM